MCGIVFFSPAHSQSKNDSSAFLKVIEPKYNFGTVEQGKIVKIEYSFQNAGKVSLIISDIEVTCGCTIADFPHYPVKPGETGMILLTFNTKGKFDHQDRTVKVISNASNSPTKLRFLGNIKEVKPEVKAK